jgi:hypothetical protein
MKTQYYRRKNINPIKNIRLKGKVIKKPEKQIYIIRAAVWGEEIKFRKRFVDFLKYSPFLVYFGNEKATTVGRLPM